jgi:hypothetical protein
MHEPSTTLVGEEEFAARLDSLIEMEDNCDNMVVFTNNVVDRSFDLDSEDDEDDSYFAEDEFLFTGEESCFALVEPIVAPNPNSTQPRELLMPRRVNMDNAEEHRASVSFGPSRLQMHEPSTTLRGEEEFAARLDSLIEMEDDCDNMFIVTGNVVGRSFDLYKEFAGKESCLASVQPIISPSPNSTQPQQLLESCFAPVRTIAAPKPNSTQPPELLIPRTVSMDNAKEHRASVSFCPRMLPKYEPSTTFAGEEKVAALVDDSSPAVQKPQTPSPQITRQRPCGETTWAMRYVELQLYNATQGDCLVPQKCKEYPRLGGWVNLQRVEYQKIQQGKKTSQMTEDRMKKLNKLGFIWDMYEAAWTMRYEELVKYKGKYGDCIVPRLHKEYPKLSAWVKNQKKEYRKKSRRMTESRIADLGVLGFVWDGQRNFCWDMYEAAWTERYEELVLYKGKHGDCIVPRLYKEYPKLGEWVSTQRKLYRGKGGKSPTEINRVRFDKLEALGFAWTVGKGSSRSRRKDKDGRDYGENAC